MKTMSCPSIKLLREFRKEDKKHTCKRCGFEIHWLRYRFVSKFCEKCDRVRYALMEKFGVDE